MIDIFVKNMVCPRCIKAVEVSLEEQSIEYINVELGKVCLQNKLSASQKGLLKEKLEVLGFELLEDKQNQIIELVKSTLIHLIQEDGNKEVMLSTLLSEKCNMEYGSISKLFTQVEGHTIERYYLSLKIEKVKELITYKEKSLKEIVFDLNYSSTAYLSSQFKKETGMTPSEFKKLNLGSRKNWNEL